MVEVRDFCREMQFELPGLAVSMQVFHRGTVAVELEAEAVVLEKDRR